MKENNEADKEGVSMGVVLERIVSKPEALDSDEYKYFHTLLVGTKPIKACELAYSGKYDNTRLYIVKGDNSFNAHAVEFVSCPADIVGSHWESSELVVQTIFEVTAYYDGVRHLEFNRNGGDMDGYLYYPEMADLIAMLQIVRDVELAHCSEAE